jgi:tetratricopeptide (TPR) repeat protein
MIQENPTGAQTSLDSLYQAETEVFSSPQLQARHILLDTYCKFKKFQEGTNDSLITIAEDYLLQHGSDYEKTLCLLFHGVIILNSEDYYHAYPYFLQAKEFGEKVNNPYFLGQIYTHLDKTCVAIRSADRLHYAERAWEQYKLYGNTRLILDAKVNYGIANYFVGNRKESWELFQETLKEAFAIHDTSNIAKSYHYMGSAEILFGQYDSALVHLQIPAEVYHQRRTCRTFNLLAQAEAHLGHKEMAYSYMDSAQLRAIYYIDRESFQETRAIVFRLFGENEKALEAMSKYTQLKDSIDKACIDNSVPKEERNQATQQLEKKDQKLNIVINVLILVIFASVGVFYYAHRKREKYKEALQTTIWKAQKTDKQAAIAQLESSPIVVQFKEYCKTHRNNKINEKDWQDLKSTFNEALPSFLIALTQDVPLSETELRICMLQKLGFPNRDISFLLNSATSTISSTSARLYKKIVKKKGGATEWSEYIQSL